MGESNDKQAFMEEMAGVRKMNKGEKAAIAAPRGKLKLDPDKQTQRDVAEGRGDSVRMELESVKPHLIGPHDILSFKSDGVQHGVYKKLRMGKYEIESSLDLHRLTVDESLKAVSQFVSEGYLGNLRTLLISHGKGIGLEEPAKLKAHLGAWLEVMPEVLAYHSAQPKDGGVGAVYILLKKSNAKKMENREKYKK